MGPDQTVTPGPNQIDILRLASHTTIGGGYRALALPDSMLTSATTAFIARTDLPSYQPADDDTLRVVGMVRKLLQRGETPPIDPSTEWRLLEKAGAELRQPSTPGDLAPRLASMEPARLTANAGSTLASGPCLADVALPYDSEQERAFHQEWVPTHLGDGAARWFIPQASLDRLLHGAGVDNSDLLDQRRVDFLVAAPWLAPFVIEIDGGQHESAVEVDREREHALARAGYDVVRVSTAELAAGSGPNLSRIAERWTDAPAGDPATTRLLLAPAHLHRFQAALLEAVQAGFLLGKRWVLELVDDLSLVSSHVEPLLEMIAAVDDLWGGVVAPELVELTAPGAAVALRFERDGLTYRRRTVTRQAEPDVRIHVEAARTPVEALPADATFPTVVVRPASLPVDVVTPMTGVSHRIPVRTDGSHTTEALRTLLRLIFAKQDFREGQQEALLEVLEGRDCVVLLPTGAGKSLVYQLAGLILPGLTLIIDPIIALMEDQVRSLASQGITRVVGISSQQVQAGRGEGLLAQVASGDAQFVFIAPERLQQRSFRDAVTQLSANMPVNLAVVDEAHCVSEWGHDFRTAYLNLGPVLRRVCKDPRGAPPPLLALTGTASRAVLRDVLFELDVDSGASPHTLIRPQTFDRAELMFEILRTEPSSAEASLRGYLQGLPGRFGRPAADIFHARGDGTYAGIVFCPFVNGDRGVWDVAEQLGSVVGSQPLTFSGSAPRRFGGNALAWERQKRINASRFMANEIPILVATKSFGMGIDKPNVRWVVHYGIPGSIEAYYQEAGRAGRDGQASRCAIVLTEFDEDRARTLLDEDLELVSARIQHEQISRADADDVSRALWFHFNSFKGVDDDLEAVAELLDTVGDLGRPRVVQVPFRGRTKDDGQERAIHRLVVLGVVADYLVDFGGRSYELRLTGADGSAVLGALLGFVERSQPSRVPVLRRRLEEREWEKPREAIIDCARALIDFVYDTIERSRRRSLREMWLAARAGDGEELRRRILDYLTEGDVAPLLEQLLDRTPFRFEDWTSQLDAIVLPEEAAEWRGNTARLLASEPDHPGLLLARAFSELLAPNGSLQEFEANLAASISSARARYEYSQEGLEQLARWLAERMGSGRPAAMGAVWALFEQHGIRTLRGAARELLDGDSPHPSLAVVHLDLALADALRGIEPLTAHYNFERHDG